MKKGGGERYNPEEAMLAQEYATKKEGKGFSEKASPESYAEAERVIGLLRDKKFDWLGIDWKKVDFKNIGEDAETRIRAGLETVLAAHEKKDAKKKPGAAAVRRFAPWTAVAAMLIAACAKEPRSPRQELEAQREQMGYVIIDDYEKLMHQAVADSSIQIESTELGFSPMVRAAIKDYKDQFDRIRKVVVSEEHMVSDRKYQLTVTIHSTDGQSYKKVVEYTFTSRSEMVVTYRKNDIKNYHAMIRSHEWDREMATTEAVINAMSEIVAENHLNFPEGRAASGGL